MSTITAPSYLDDGISFSRRLPTSPTPHPRPAASDTSAYTGSYIDDGLDLLPPTNGRGFGDVDRRFYRNRRRRREDGDGGVWSKDIARAVTGDVQRSLARLNELGGIGVRRPADNEGREGESKGEKQRKKEQKRRGVVGVPAPVRWGTFVIKGDDGRVVVVGEEGEWDSGPVRGEGDVKNEGKEDKGMDGVKRWVRAASTIAEDPLPLQTDPIYEKATPATSARHRSRSRKERKNRKRTSHHHTPPHQPNPPAPKSEYEYEYDSNPSDPVPLFPLASPTDFFMTGGQSGWSSRTASPENRSPVVPHAITWDTLSPARTLSGQTYTRPAASNARTKSRKDSKTKEWTSTTSSSSTTPSTSYHMRRSPAQDRSYKKPKSRAGRYSPLPSVSVYGLEKTSTRRPSTYQTPDIVEVTYDETPPGEVAYSHAQPEMGWGGAVGEQSEAGTWTDKLSIRIRNRKDSEEEEDGDLGWGSAAQGSDRASRSRRSDVSVGSHADSVSKSVHGWTASALSVRSQDRGRGDAGEWDGFERPKSGSEVSVYGGSVRSGWSRASQRSHHTSRPAHTHASRGSECINTGWDGEEIRSKAGSTVLWDEGGGGGGGQTWAGE